MGKKEFNPTDKWIAYVEDDYDIKHFITSYDDESYKTNNNIFSLLITEDEKKKVRKVVRRKNCGNIKFVRLSKYNFISEAARDAIYNMGYRYQADPKKWFEGKDDLTLECKRFANEEDLTNIKTFKEFGEIIAKMFIEKYNLEKREPIVEDIDFSSDEDFNIPTEIDREELADDILQFADWLPDASTIEEAEEMRKIILEAIDEQVEAYTHENGKVYVDDWDIFDSDLKYRVIGKWTSIHPEED